MGRAGGPGPQPGQRAGLDAGPGGGGQQRQAGGGAHPGHGGGRGRDQRAAEQEGQGGGRGQHPGGGGERGHGGGCGHLQGAPASRGCPARGGPHAPRDLHWAGGVPVAGGPGEDGAALDLLVPGTLRALPGGARGQAAAAGGGGPAGPRADGGPDAGQVPDAGAAPGGPHRARGQPRPRGRGHRQLPRPEQVLSAPGQLRSTISRMLKCHKRHCLELFTHTLDFSLLRDMYLLTLNSFFQMKI